MAHDIAFGFGNSGLMMPDRSMLGPLPKDGDVPHKLAEWRSLRELTQQQLADLANSIDRDAKLTGNDISRFEKGRRGLNARWQYVFARALDIPVDAIYRSPRKISIDAKLSSVGADDETWRLVEHLVDGVLAARRKESD